MVTPYVVRAVAQKELSRPDDGFAPASDSQSALLARINRIYGLAARADAVARRHPGQFRLHHRLRRRARHRSGRGQNDDQDNTPIAFERCGLWSPCSACQCMLGACNQTTGDS